MTVRFETCDRQRALSFLRRFLPSYEIEDTPDCAGPVLDLVEADIVRIPDPEFHPSGAIHPSENWDESRREEIFRTFNDFMASIRPARMEDSQ